MDHVSTVLGVAWRSLDLEDPAVLAAVARVREEAVAAKEQLSHDTEASIPVVLPGIVRGVRITRGEFESAIRLRVLRTVDHLAQAIEAAGADPADLRTVLLVGGSSRIPLVSRLVSARLGLAVGADANAEYAVCLGAAIAAGGRLEAQAGLSGSPLRAQAPAPAPVTEEAAMAWWRPEPAPEPEPRPSPGPAGRPGLIDEDVRFSVFRPRALAVGEWASLLVVAHKSQQYLDPERGVVDPLEDVNDLVEGRYGETPIDATNGDARQALGRGSELRVVPDLPGIVCNPPAFDFTWLEAVHEAHFRVRPRADLVGRIVRGFVRIWYGRLILGELSVAIPVVEERPPTVASRAALDRGEEINLYRKIFPSYSHRDRDMVRYFQAAAYALGDQYLQDVVSLRSGEPWDERLLELIGEADVFQLFWSHNSMRSPYCRREWERALALHRPSFVRPLYWEDPLPEDPALGLPPGDLRALHFAHVPVTPLPFDIGTLHGREPSPAVGRPTGDRISGPAASTSTGAASRARPDGPAGHVPPPLPPHGRHTAPASFDMSGETASGRSGAVLWGLAALLAVLALVVVAYVLTV
jgi:hypothetical protein